MSNDRCEDALSAVQSLLTGRDWAKSAEQSGAEVDGVTTVAVIMNPVSSSNADDYAKDLTLGMKNLGYDCTVDLSFKGVRTVTRLDLSIRTGDFKSL